MKTTQEIKTQKETAYKEAQPHLSKFIRILGKHGIECPTCVDYNRKLQINEAWRSVNNEHQCENCDPILLSRWWPKEEDDK